MIFEVIRFQFFAQLIWFFLPLYFYIYMIGVYGNGKLYGLYIIGFWSFMKFGQEILKFSKYPLLTHVYHGNLVILKIKTNINHIYTHCHGIFRTLLWHFAKKLIKFQTIHHFGFHRNGDHSLFCEQWSIWKFRTCLNLYAISGRNFRSYYKGCILLSVAFLQIYSNPSFNFVHIFAPIDSHVIAIVV